MILHRRRLTTVPPNKGLQATALRAGPEAQGVGRAGVAVATLGCAIALTVLMRIRWTTPAEPVLVAPSQPPP